MRELIRMGGVRPEDFPAEIPPAQRINDALMRWEVRGYTGEISGGTGIKIINPYPGATTWDMTRNIEGMSGAVSPNIPRPSPVSIPSR